MLLWMLLRMLLRMMKFMQDDTKMYYIKGMLSLHRDC